LGNYERFLDVTLTRDHNLTTGKVYSQVINAERRGDYLGKTVQVIPHVTDAIQDWIDRVSHQIVDAQSSVANGSPPPDVCLIEVGGTVGDIESLVFLEALRQFQFRVGPDNFCLVHVSLVPVLGSVGEQKTKPTQHTVKELRSVGLNPDIILCRSAAPLSSSTREKLALFCQVPSEAVLTVHDVPNIYHVPLLLEAQGVVGIISRCLRLQISQSPALGPWRTLAASVDNATTEVRIALVGKYTGLQDSYLSVIKALQHASIAVGRRLLVDWVDATALEAAAEKSDPEAFAHSWETMRTCNGVLVPGGFGDRGVEGKIAAIKYARENNLPFFGICLGMQCAVIEHARSVLGWAGANSAEFDPKSPHPVVIFMPEINPSQMGGTMRLGARPTLLRNKEGRTTLAQDLYGKNVKCAFYVVRLRQSKRHRAITPYSSFPPPLLRSRVGAPSSQIRGQP
jgi:CTP synthase